MKTAIDEVLEAIARLTPRQRAELKKRLARSPWWAEPSAKPAVRTAETGWQPDFVVVFDGGSYGNPGPGYGSFLLMRRHDGAQRHKSLKFGEMATNNEAEYDTLVAALNELVSWIQEAGGDPRHTSIEVRGDSQLVISQVRGEWKAREKRMAQRRDKSLRLLKKFGAYRLVQHPREESVRLLGH